MRKLMTIAVLGLFVSSSVFAAGSKIQGSTITNDAKVKNSTNFAISGLGSAEANQASVKIKGSEVKNSTITNKADVKNSTNFAISGLGSAKANQASTVIE